MLYTSHKLLVYTLWSFGLHSLILYGKEQHEHSAKHLLLCSTEESQSYGFETANFFSVFPHEQLSAAVISSLSVCESLSVSLSLWLLLQRSVQKPHSLSGFKPLWSPHRPQGAVSATSLVRERVCVCACVCVCVSWRRSHSCASVMGGLVLV